MFLRKGNSYARWLTGGTLFYLLFPFLLFLAGWIRSILAIPACLSILVSTYYFLKQTYSDRLESAPFKYQIGILLLAIYWCFIAGLGEWMPQSTDFFKHNLVFADLVRFDWPVRYEHSGFLCYYLAYYLPVALAGKLIGIQFVPALSFLWSLGGLYIIFNWILVIGGHYRAGALLGFTLLSGFHLIRFGVNKLFGLSISMMYKTLPPLVYYPYSIKQWLYIPQQVLGALLVVGWVYVEMFQRKRYTSVFYISSLGLFYSPFAIIGLTPLIIAGWPTHWRQFISIPNLLGASIVTFFLAGYYLAHYPINASGWNFPSTGTEFCFLINTLFADVALPFLLVWLIHQRYNVLTKQQMVFISIASIIKLLLAFYFVGYNNDLLMNASLSLSSILFILMGIALQQLSEKVPNQWPVRFISILLIVISFLPAYMHVSLFTDYSETRRYANVAPSLNKTVGYTINDLNQFMHYRFKPNQYYDFARQYIGNPDHFFNRYILK
ncbi:hypothetical protein [Spirosoma sp.]|uniref:hypothetical protein n=1 Tax=Spirosoma sp. TaxID=1899569 RepID=UPI003B3B285D